MSWTFVGHVHTKYSPDSLTEPRALVERALELGIDVLAVTDHDTWRGAVETLGVAHKTNAPLRVIVGSEVHTDQGDVIGLFLKDDLRDVSAPDFCDAVHEHDGLIWLPHPFKWHRLDDELLSRCDLIEIHNGRTGRADNQRAAELAKERGLAELVGPDAHRAGELHLAQVRFEGDLPLDEAGLKQALLHAPRTFHLTKGSIWNDWLSVGAWALKRPSLPMAWRLVRGAAHRMLKPNEHDLG